MDVTGFELGLCDVGELRQRTLRMFLGGGAIAGGDGFRSGDAAGDGPIARSCPHFYKGRLSSMKVQAVGGIYPLCYPALSDRPCGLVRWAWARAGGRRCGRY